MVGPDLRRRARFVSAECTPRTPKTASRGPSCSGSAGLSGWTQETIHVSLPRNSRVRSLPGVRVHVLRKTRCRDGVGLPRAPVEVAVVHAAQWAVSDKQSATLLAMAVQQRLVPPQRILEHWATVRRSPRRRFLDLAIRDVCDGARSLDELDSQQPAAAMACLSRPEDAGPCPNQLRAGPPGPASPTCSHR